MWNQLSSSYTYIVIITDTIHSMQQIFDLSIYPYQSQFITIVKDLRLFFEKYLLNTIKFWDFFSDTK